METIGAAPTTQPLPTPPRHSQPSPPALRDVNTRPQSPRPAWPTPPQEQSSPRPRKPPAAILPQPAATLASAQTLPRQPSLSRQKTCPHAKLSSATPPASLRLSQSPPAQKM